MKLVNGKRVYDCTMDYPLGFSKHVWNRIWLSPPHIFGPIGIYMLFTGMLPFPISFFLVLSFGYYAGAGTTMGCHRLWAHKSYKAKLPLQIILMIAQTMAVQYPIFKWCRDHRLHHKYTETDADPHNARRGFYFAHMGWLFQEEHPMVKEKEETIDMSDLDNDPVVRFQTRFYWPLLILIHFCLPIGTFHYILPQLSWFELLCLHEAWYVFSLHFTWLVNSAAHLHGPQPYDKNVFARENGWVAAVALGEGWHNYHHVFPWDYKTAEIGWYKLNWACMMIDFFARIGWAHDLKTVPEEIVRQRVKRTGDVREHERHIGKGYSGGGDDEGDNRNVGESESGRESSSESPCWGWGDPDASPELVQCTQTLRPAKMA